METDAVHVRDGVVMALMGRDIVVLTSDLDINSQDFEVFIPDQGEVKNVKILASGAGIAILLCRNLSPDQQRALAEVELFEGDLQEFQEVYTYSHQNKYRVLTPGNIMLVQILKLLIFSLIIVLVILKVFFFVLYQVTL